ncbi:MAG: hypothetical protein OEW11_04260 [Nitrospirota bacterium]|nr:hypothetical protein [Nitrospirota bacterium]
MFGMTIGATLAVAITGVLFLWGLYMGLRGVLAEAPPFREGGHAWGKEGTFDPLFTEGGMRARKAA